MSPQEAQKAKERILKTAISLFGQKGYSAVGVREIASAANVNIAMISYYFNGKIGILKEIIELFFSRYHDVFKNSNDPDIPAEVCLEQLIFKIVCFIRDNTELTATVFNTLPFDIPEIANIKRRYILQVTTLIQDLLSRFGLDSKDMKLMTFIGPSIISIILTNFRLQSTFKQTFDIDIDKNYYEQLTQRVTTLLLEGVKGLHKS